MKRALRSLKVLCLVLSDSTLTRETRSEVTCSLLFCLVPTLGTFPRLPSYIGLVPRFAYTQDLNTHTHTHPGTSVGLHNLTQQGGFSTLLNSRLSGGRAFPAVER